jgi:hypothetical protein
MRTPLSELVKPMVEECDAIVEIEAMWEEGGC